MRVLIGTLFLILPIFCQPTLPPVIEKLQESLLAIPNHPERTPTIYCHGYEDYSREYFHSLPAGLVYVVVEKLHNFIIGYAQEKNGIFYLVPFCEDGFHGTLGIQRLKMKIVDSKAEQYVTLHPSEEVNKLFFHPIDQKYIFTAKAGAPRRKNPPIPGGSGDGAFYENYHQNYPDHRRRMI